MNISKLNTILNKLKHERNLYKNLQNPNLVAQEKKGIFSPRLLFSFHHNQEGQGLYLLTHCSGSRLVGVKSPGQ